jgi:hypothetical protein
MKKILVFALAAASLTACNDQKNNNTATNSDTTVTTTTTADVSGNTSTASTYVPADGDVMYRDGKLMVWRNNAYVLADTDITQDSGIVVRRNGEVIREGRVVKLEEGQAVSKTGRFFNKAGEAIGDAWDATKKGVGKAADAVKKGANKVGEGVKKAVD